MQSASPATPPRPLEEKPRPLYKNARVEYAVLETLAAAHNSEMPSMRARDIWRDVGGGWSSTSRALGHLWDLGHITRLGYGRYAITPQGVSILERKPWRIWTDGRSVDPDVLHKMQNMAATHLISCGCGNPPLAIHGFMNPGICACGKEYRLRLVVDVRP